MILFKITNIENNKFYINYKISMPICLKRIKNKNFKDDFKKYGSNSFIIDILLNTENKEEIKKIYKTLINAIKNSKEGYLLYNNLLSGKIIVIDENGKNIKIGVDDERYISGKLKHVSTGKIPVIDLETSKNTSVYSNDPLYNVRYIPITKGKVITKDKQGNTFFIEKTDPRYKKELQFIFSGESISENRLKNLLNTNKNKRKILYSDFEMPIEHDNKSRQYIIKNFCKHGDLQIDPKIFNALYKENRLFLCEKCKNEYYNNYVFNIEELKYFQTLYKTDTCINLYIETWVKTYKHKLYYYINEFTKHILDIPWNQKIYLFKNNLLNKPKCRHKNCYNDATYNDGMKRYNLNCLVHTNSTLSNTSKLEKEIYIFLTQFYNKEIECNVKYLIKKELDIYIPEFKLGVEYNGLYWHSELNKEKTYHYDKWKLCNKSGISLITIWEDDWTYKQEIVKSILLNAIEKTPYKIYARKCEVKLVEYSLSKYFLETNHIQGNCASSIRLGLFYENELVSLMTFSKLRSITNSCNDKNDNFELIRFCSKLNTNVVGGASKLFSHFLKLHNPNKVISYSTLEFGKNTLYEILGFNFIKHTGVKLLVGKRKTLS